MEVCTTVVSHALLSSRITLAMTNTHETTNSELATMTPSRTDRHRLRLGGPGNSTSDAIAPAGYKRRMASATAG